MEEIVNNETVKKEEKTIPKKTSTIEKFGKLCMKGGEAMGKMATEFFTGKPLTEEQKQEAREERAHQRELRRIQAETRREIELEMARQGKIPPSMQKKEKKDTNIFSNLGKHNPLEGFNSSNSIGSNNFGVEHFSGIRPVKQKDLEINGYDRDPLE